MATIPDLAIAMTELPRFFVMRANSKGAYMGVQEPMGFMSFDVTEIFSPRVKFAVEKSAGGDHTLVHIRCCYTNKYWVVHDIDGRLWIRASADKRQEDPTKPACTLFRPTSGPEAQTFSFRSIAKNMNIVSNIENGLELGVDTTFFPTVDWETLVILPSQVTFRSKELDGAYLCSRELYGNCVLSFESEVDVGDPLVAHELFPTPDGNYRIKNVYFGKFIHSCSRLHGMVYANVEDDDNLKHNNDTLFSFVKISDGVIALRNLSTNCFCGAGKSRIATTDNRKFLIADYPTMSRQTKLMVEERVLEREIFDLQYRFSNSRIYNEEIQEVSHAFATNNSPDNETKVTLSYSSSDSRTTSWTSTVSVTLGVTVKFETNIIPFISKVDVQGSIETGYTHGWGVTETTERKREASYVVVVPPLTTMKVTLMSTRAACDVPFSFTQRDLLTTGKRVTTIKNDGIFTGINSYNFYFESDVVPHDQPSGKLYM